MKAVKKFIIFAIFAAGAFGLLSLLASPHQHIDNTTLMAGNVDRLREDINARWNEATGWDADLYGRQLTRVSQSQSAGVIDALARRSLVDLINRRAYDKSIEAMDRQFARNACDANILAHNAEGLSTVIDHEPAVAQLPDVEKALETYALYRRIVAFNNASVGLTPSFDYEQSTWSPSFPDYAGRIRARRDELLAAPYYHRLAGIDDIKKIHNTNDKLARASESYYNALVNKIRRAYLDLRSPEGDNHELRSRFAELRSKAYNEFTPAANMAMADIHRQL